MACAARGRGKGDGDSGAQVAMTREEEVVWDGGRPESGSGCVKRTCLTVSGADVCQPAGNPGEGREETNIHPRERVVGQEPSCGRGGEERVEGSA